MKKETDEEINRKLFAIDDKDIVFESDGEKFVFGKVHRYDKPVACGVCHKVYSPAFVQPIYHEGNVHIEIGFLDAEHMLLLFTVKPMGEEMKPPTCKYCLLPKK